MEEENPYPSDPFYPMYKQLTDPQEREQAQQRERRKKRLAERVSDTGL